MGLNLGQDWEFQPDAPNNRLFAEYGPTGSSVSFGEDGDLTLDDGNLDLSGGSLTDSSQDYVDLSGGGSDLRLATGQAIEDGNGNRRLSIEGDETRLRFEDEVTGLRLNKGNFHRVNSFDNTPFQLADKLGDFIVAEYQPVSAAPGTLELTNAQLRIVGSGVGENSGFGNTGMIVGPHESDATLSQNIEFVNENGDFSRVSLNNDELQVGGPLRVEDDSLIIEVGQSIQDDGGTRRVDILSDRTRFHDNDGRTVLTGVSGGANQLKAYPNTPLRITDEEGIFTAVDYIASASPPGTLELTNADLDVLSDEGTVDTKITVSGDSSGQTASKIRAGVNVSLQDDESTIIEDRVQFDTAGFVAVRNESSLGGLSAAFVNDDVNILASKGSVATSDTDGSICLFVDANDDLILKNRTGAQESFTVSGLLTS